jgi:hypothetical protein
VVIPVARKVVATNRALHAELSGAALDHAIGIDPVHGLAVEHAGAAKGGAEEGAFAILTYPGGLDVFVQKRFELIPRLGEAGAGPECEIRKVPRLWPWPC